MAYLENNSIDLSHSFDLNGTDNDEMLRLYLRKAGCSDKIEYLSPEERKAFIYDIIKSNKMPGYWVPSTMRASAFPAPPPELLQTPQPQPQMISAPMYAVHNNNQSSTPTPTLSSSSSSHSLKSLPQHSSTYYAAPPTPPSPTTFVTSHKGSKYQISGPMNFRHLDGDMTRDMTRNAFDLNSETNDNILKKYMIERNIKEQDLTGMRKRDIIRNIVHSKFTWKPNKKKEQINSEPELKYASISSNFERTPPPDEFEESPIPFEKFSNFNLVSARFNDPSLFPKPDEIFGQPSQENNNIGTANLAAPPPPSAVQAVHNYSRHYSRSDSYYATLPRQKESNLAVANESLYATVKAQRKEKPLRVDIPMPPAPSLQQEQQFGSRRGLVPPPTPPKPVSKNGAFPAFAMGTQSTPQQQMPLMKNHQTKPPPPPIRKTIGVGAPPPPPPLPAISNANGGSVPMTAIPPPPPPPTANSGNTLIPPPPPPPPLLNSGGGPVPPPPPMPANAAVPKRLQENNEKAPNLTGDPRDELLNSIRNGVTLRKVNQKASTISGIKPRPKSKPPAVDFLSELKMGITLRRVKNPADNPYAKDVEQESEA